MALSVASSSCDMVVGCDSCTWELDLLPIDVCGWIEPIDAQRAHCGGFVQRSEENSGENYENTR